MKTIQKNVLYFALALAGAVNAIAADGKTSNPCFAVLSKATQVEMPAKAAELVSKAAPAQRRQTTIDVVQAAVPLNPAAAPVIVGSIAQAAPDMAAVAAAIAVGLVPDQAEVIARAVVAAAPNEAGKIVEAICRVLPKDYQKIAIAVADVVPNQGKEILAAVAAAVPALQASLNQVLASYSGNNIPSVETVLKQASSSRDAGLTASLTQSTVESHALAGPTVGPPFVPLPVSHGNIDPGSGGEVPTGGRDYAAP